MSFSKRHADRAVDRIPFGEREPRAWFDASPVGMPTYGPEDAGPPRSLVIRHRPRGQEIDDGEGLAHAPGVRIRIEKSGTFLHYRRSGWLPLGASVRVPVAVGEDCRVRLLHALDAVGELDAELSTEPPSQPRDRLWDVRTYDVTQSGLIYPVPEGAKRWAPVSLGATLGSWVYVSPLATVIADMQEVSASPGDVLGPFWKASADQASSIEIAWEIEL